MLDSNAFSDLMRKDPRIEARLAALDPNDKVVICQPVPESAGDAYANITRTRERQGLRLDENDLWIAATASTVGATLVSRDSDFSSVEGLATTDWTA